MKIYTRDEVERATLEYFKGDKLATNVWVTKYAWCDGDDFYELTPDNMHNRMAKQFAKIAKRYTVPHDKIELLSRYGQTRQKLTAKNIYERFEGFADIIPQGSIMAVLGTGQIGSLSNCVTLPPIFDSYGGILDTDQQLTQVFKRRGGAGIDISTLRPNMTKVNNVAKTSSGAVGFMHRFSNTSREVGQGGRRSALMITMSVRHPDIEEFIQVKQDLAQVTGANISVKFTDDFIEAVENDTNYILRFPVDSTPENAKMTKVVRAKDIWELFVKAAHKSGEPGAGFWDKITKYSTDHYYTPIVTSNPSTHMRPLNAS